MTLSSPKTKTVLVSLAGLGLLVAGWMLGGQARAQQEPVAHDAHAHPHDPFEARPAYVPAPTPNDAAKTAAAEPAPAEARPGYLPPSEFHPRDPDEWQGMKVDLTLQPPCMESMHCGQAMACNLATNRCGPCEVDADCGGTEACVLDHCVPSDEAACRSRHDCPDDALCVLSGLSADPRGNLAMRSFCQASEAGQPEVAEDHERVPAGAPITAAALVEHPPSYGAKLLESLRAPEAAE